MFTPVRTNLCDVEGVNSSMVTVSDLLAFRPVQKVLNNNSTKPSMKKETHCFYRYSIWHRKHGSTLGLGGLRAGLLDTGPLPTASWPTCFLPRKPDLRGGQIDLSQLFLPRHNPVVSLRGSVLEKIHCEKELGLSRKEIGSPSKPQKSALRKPRTWADWPSGYSDILGKE